METGNIHSVESMGLVDGPGIRYVVFMQGCHIRCIYCHNPDTWSLSGGEKMTADALVKKLVRFKPYFDASGGGVTFSGGEPLLQYAFLTEALKKCKEAGIHTAIDTAGVGMGHYDELLRYTDLVLLDIKHTQEEGYKRITGFGMEAFYEFLAALKRAERVDVWLRAVIIPTINDHTDYIRELWTLAKKIPRVKKIELLPYHTLGVNKYRALGLEYPIPEIPPMNRRHVERWQEVLNKALITDEAGSGVAGFSADRFRNNEI